MKQSVFLLISLVLLQGAHAEFTLDDFDDGFSLFRPHKRLSGISDEVWQLDIGDITARRRVTLADRRPGLTEVTATFETVDSAAVADLIEVPPREPQVAQYSGFGFFYDFIVPGQECPLCLTALHELRDFSEGGANNAILLDFAFVRGPTPPKSFVLSMTNPSNYAFAYLLDQDLREREDEFTFVVPFGKFQDRVLRPTSVQPDFSQTGSLNIAIYSSGRYDRDTYDPEFEENFTFGIDAIRVGHIKVDFNGDGRIDVSDADALTTQIVANSNSEDFDISKDGVIDRADLDLWLAFASYENGFASQFHVGDSNLDGIVDASDLDALGQNWLSHPNSWQGGDFNADGIVNSLDLNMLGKNWLRSVPSPDVNVANVPEPHTLLLLSFITPLLAARRLKPKSA